MKRIAFCSYKGGSGRTVALANIAMHLAYNGYRVGCIDLDIESCGLHKVFDMNVSSETKHTVQRYFLTEQMWMHIIAQGRRPRFEGSDFNSLVYSLKECIEKDSLPYIDKIKGEIFVIIALPQPRIAAAALRNERFSACTSVLFDLFENNYKLDYLLIDCRSGISTLSLPGLRWAHNALLFFRPGKQHMMGTSELARWILTDRMKRIQGIYDEEEDSHLPEKVSLIGSAVPSKDCNTVTIWMDELIKQIKAPELVALHLIKDDEGLRSDERIFEPFAPNSTEMGIVYDSLAEKLI